MAFTRFPDPTNNISNLANQPVESAAVLKQKFDQFGEDDKDYTNNTLLPELESTTDGDSGLDNIGMTPIAGYTNPQTMLEHLEADKTPLTGNHLGTWQGYSPVQSDPGIQAIVNDNVERLDNNDKIQINVLKPPAPLVAAKNDGTETFTQLQNLINWAHDNNYSLFAPSGVYKCTGKLLFEDGSIFKGSGMKKTVIHSFASGQFAMEILGDGSPTYPYFETELSDFAVVGNGTSSVASSATGGILVNGSEHAKLERIITSEFCSSGWNSIGNPATEKRAGIAISGVIGAIIRNCYSFHNDIGFKVDKGVVSVNTTTTFIDCTASINRTHGVLFEDTMTTTWLGGGIESNAGLITVRITNSGPNEFGINMRNVHFEDNHRLITPALGNGTREVKVEGFNINNTLLDNLFFSSPSDFCVEFSNTQAASIGNCLFAGYNSFLLNPTAKNTNVFGGLIQSQYTDNGVGTRVYGASTVVNNDADFSGGITAITGKSYAKLEAITIDNLTLGKPGQIVTLEGRTGSVLDSATNFILKNGSPYMRLAAGSTITVRKNKDTGKWTLINHQPSVAKSNLANTAFPLMDDRPFWIVDDTNTTAIGMHPSGYDGQIVTILGKHTGINTTTFNNSGYLSLAGGTCVLGLNDTLTLIYDLQTTKWHELSRSVNT